VTPADLAAAWRCRAAELERFAPAAAVAFRDAADELAESLRAQADAELTLEQAAQASGYSPRRLRELLASGAIPNAGARGRPRIRRADLPRRARPANTNGDYDASEDARRLLSRA
jgi:hypothetical protein